MKFLAATETFQESQRVDVQMLLVLWRQQEKPRDWWVDFLTRWAKILYPDDPGMNPQITQGSLYEAFSVMLSELKTRSPEEQKFMKNFSFRNLSRVVCDKCKAQSRLSSESELFLSVEFNSEFPENDENGVNIVALLEKQDLVASDWRCPSRCESGKTHISNHYEGLPEVLVIQLKRIFPENYVSREDSESGVEIVLGRHKHKVRFDQFLLLWDTSNGKMLRVTYQIKMVHYHGTGTGPDEPFSEGSSSYSVTRSGHYFTSIHQADGSATLRSDHRDCPKTLSLQELHQAYGRKAVALQYIEIDRQENVYASPPPQPQPPSTTLNHLQPPSSSTLQPASTNLPHPPVTPQAQCRRKMRGLFLLKEQDSGNSSSSSSSNQIKLSHVSLSTGPFAHAPATAPATASATATYRANSISSSTPASSSCASPVKATFAQAAATPAPRATAAAVLAARPTTAATSAAQATAAATDRPGAAANLLGHQPEVTHGLNYDGSPDQVSDGSPDQVCRKLFPLSPLERDDWQVVNRKKNKPLTFIDTQTTATNGSAKRHLLQNGDSKFLSPTTTTTNTTTATTTTTTTTTTTSTTTTSKLPTTVLIEMGVCLQHVGVAASVCLCVCVLRVSICVCVCLCICVCCLYLYLCVSEHVCLCRVQLLCAAAVTRSWYLLMVLHAGTFY